MQTPEAIIRNTLKETIKTITTIDEGWTNLVFEVNNKWIFRFVRDTSNTQLAVEKSFLPFFQTQSPLPIPKLQHTGSNFIGYEKIAGYSFSEDLFSSLSESKQDEAAKTLGQFLSCLHAIKFEHEHLKQAPFGGDHFWQDLWPSVYPRLSKSIQQKAEDYFRKVIPAVTSTFVNKSITHSDFGTNNVLFDTTKEKIAGIIDFGDLSMSDPAIDFATFYRRFGRPFAEKMLTHYSLPLGENFWIRVDYEAKRKFFFIVYFALHHGFENNVPAIIEAIENQFDEY